MGFPGVDGVIHASTNRSAREESFDGTDSPAIIPRPAVNLLIYHGVLAPHARIRSVTDAAKPVTVAKEHLCDGVRPSSATRSGAGLRSGQQQGFATGRGYKVSLFGTGSYVPWFCTSEVGGPLVRRNVAPRKKSARGNL